LLIAPQVVPFHEPYVVMVFVVKDESPNPYFATAVTFP